MSITYGAGTILMDKAGVVDTGTTGILLATGTCLECSKCSLFNQSSIDAFNAYKDATGAVLAENDYLSITPQQYADLQPLTFHAGSVRLFCFKRH